MSTNVLNPESTTSAAPRKAPTSRPPTGRVTHIAAPLPVAPDVHEPWRSAETTGFLVIALAIVLIGTVVLFGAMMLV